VSCLVAALLSGVGGAWAVALVLALLRGRKELRELQRLVGCDGQERQKADDAIL
jgi:DNA-binding HxlR family transcriptional regulator